MTLASRKRGPQRNTIMLPARGGSPASSTAASQAPAATTRRPLGAASNPGRAVAWRLSPRPPGIPPQPSTARPMLLFCAEGLVACCRNLHRRAAGSDEPAPAERKGKKTGPTRAEAYSKGVLLEAGPNPFRAGAGFLVGAVPGGAPPLPRAHRRQPQRH